MKIKPVDSMTSCLDRFSPKMLRCLVFIKHRSCHLYERSVLPLNNSILLRSVRSRELMQNSFLIEKRVYIGVLELRSIVAPNFLDLHLKLILGLFGKGLEDPLNLRFIIKEKYPRKSGIIINYN